MKPGIYITLANHEVVYISYKDLTPWKEFATKYTCKDILQVKIVCLSLQNAQLLVDILKGDELKGLEICYRASKMLFGGPMMHYVAIYIPGRNPPDVLLINQSSRLCEKKNVINEPRKKLFYLK